MKRIRTVSICVGFIIAGLYIWGNYTFEAFFKNMLPIRKIPEEFASYKYPMDNSDSLQYKVTGFYNVNSLIYIDSENNLILRAKEMLHRIAPDGTVISDIYDEGQFTTQSTMRSVQLNDLIVPVHLNAPPYQTSGLEFLHYQKEEFVKQKPFDGFGMPSPSKHMEPHWSGDGYFLISSSRFRFKWTLSYYPKEGYKGLQTYLTDTYALIKDPWSNYFYLIRFLECY